MGLIRAHLATGGQWRALNFGNSMHKQGITRVRPQLQPKHRHRRKHKHNSNRKHKLNPAQWASSAKWSGPTCLARPSGKVPSAK